MSVRRLKKRTLAVHVSAMLPTYPTRGLGPRPRPLNRDPKTTRVPPVEDRREQRRDLHGVELEIGVLHHDDVARRALESGTYRAALTAGGVFEHEHELGRLFEGEESLARPVGRSAVDDDDLLRHAAVDLADAFEERDDRVALVSHRYDDRQLHGFGSPTSRAASSSCSMRSIASHGPLNGYATTRCPDAAAVLTRSGIS